MPPLPLDGRVVGRRNRPVGFEAAEVIDPGHVDHVEDCRDPAGPPVEQEIIGRLFVAIPAIQGVAPALAGGAEIVGGDAGDVGRQQRPVIEGEDRLVGPDVDTVEADIDRDVAEQADARLLRGQAQQVPLAEKFELLELEIAEPRHVFLSEGGKRVGMPLRQFRGPVEPAGVAEPLLDGHEQGVVIEPGRCRRKTAEGAAAEPGKPVECLRQQPFLVFRDRDVIGAVGREAGVVAEARFGDQSLGEQDVGRNEQGGSGEGRGTHVGRIVK